MFDNRLLAILRAAAVHIKRKQILYNTASDIIHIDSSLFSTTLIFALKKVTFAHDSDFPKICDISLKLSSPKTRSRKTSLYGSAMLWTVLYMEIAWSLSSRRSTKSVCSAARSISSVAVTFSLLLQSLRYSFLRLHRARFQFCSLPYICRNWCTLDKRFLLLVLQHSENPRQGKADIENQRAVFRIDDLKSVHTVPSHLFKSIY